MECKTEDQLCLQNFRFKNVKVKLGCVVFLVLLPLCGCGISKLQVVSVPEPPIPVPEILPFFHESSLSITYIVELQWNSILPYEEEHYEKEEVIVLSDDLVISPGEYYGEEVVEFPTVQVHEPDLIEDPFIEDNCGESAYSWCDPRYENDYLAYLEHEKEQKQQAAIFPNFVAPIDEGLILRGMQPSTKKRRGHYGLDIIPRNWVRNGAPIKSVEDGVVVECSWARGYGYYTIIYHQNGIFSLYSHTQKKNRVKFAQKVNRGDTIALMGKSGNAQGYHLHFELIDLRENWDLQESIDDFITSLCRGECQESERGQFNQLLFARQMKKDPLENIPGLAFAKKVKGKWIAVDSISPAKTNPQAAKNN
ncbi:M23 family metallopeptidase [bacterium]|nr:M23 family metallopeptidase [candidate division CSSED10-310 bacterium]